MTHTDILPPPNNEKRHSHVHAIAQYVVDLFTPLNGSDGVSHQWGQRGPAGFFYAKSAESTASPESIIGLHLTQNAGESHTED